MREAPFEVTLRTAAGDLRASARTREARVSQDFLCALATREFGWERPRIVHEGGVLLPGATVDLRSSSSVFLVVPRRPFAARPAAPATRTEAETPPDEEAFDASSAPPARVTLKRCRICFEEEEEEQEERSEHELAQADRGHARAPRWGSRFISPCMCRGTMQYVHIDCLNHWRRLSASRAAFFKCPQCGFQYLLARTQAAKYIEVLASDQVCAAIAALVLAVATTVAASAMHQTGADLWVRRYASLPVPREVRRYLGPTTQALVDYYWTGLLTVGAVGAVQHVLQLIDDNYWRVRHHVNPVDLFWDNPNVLLIGCGLATHTNESLSRTLLVVGIVFCAVHLFKGLKRMTRRYLQTFGEMVLEPRASTASNHPHEAGARPD